MRAPPPFLVGAMSTLISVVLVTTPSFAQEADPAQADETPAVESKQIQREVPGGLEEIVVTAEKREASIQDTPIAVSAFDTERMKELVINNANDYTLLVPSLSYRTSPNRMFIRGIGRTDNSLGLDPGVAVYTDGVYTSETAWLFSNSFTIDRMEILRGPQGTLYGRNTTGGAVNAIVKKPEEEWHTEARVKLGNYNTREYGLAVTGPITDWFRFRATVTDARHDGYQKNLTGRDLGDANGRFYQAQIEIDLTEDLTFWAKYQPSYWNYHPMNDVRLTPYFTTLFAGDLWPRPQFGYDEITNPNLRDFHKVAVSDVGEINLRDTYHAAGKLTWDAGPVVVSYLYGFQTYDWFLKDTDIDGIANFEMRDLNYTREDKQYYSHELQINSNTDSALQWIAGLYYYNEEIEQPYVLYRPDSNAATLCVSCGVGTVPFLGGGAWDVSELVPNVAPEAGGRQGITYSQQGKLKAKAYAAYGEFNYDLTDALKLTVGGRYSYDRKTGEEYQWMTLDPVQNGFLYEEGRTTFFYQWNTDFGEWDCTNPEVRANPDLGWACTDFLPTVEGGVAWLWSEQRRRLSHDWSSWVGRILLDYFPDDDTMVYASISQGYKAGAMRLGSLFASDPSIKGSPIADPEKLYAFEVGYKSTFADKFRLNAAAYYYNYRDQHVFLPFLDTNSGITHAQVINAKKSYIYGLELETLFQATDALAIDANYSYMRGRFEDFCCHLDNAFPDINGDGNPDGPTVADLQDLKGHDLLQTPEHKIFVGATYTFFTDLGDISLRGQYGFVDKQTYNVFNTTWAPSFHRLDFFVTYRDPEERWTVIGYMKNADDEDNLSHQRGLGRADRANEFGGFPNIPRTFGVEVLLRY